MSTNNAEKLVQALSETEEHKYAKHVAKAYDFSFSVDWDRSKVNLLKDINDPAKPKCTIENLAIVFTRVLISANNHIFISTYDDSKVDIKNKFDIKKTIIPSNLSSSNYPCMVDFEKNDKASTGHFLCDIIDTGDGVALIFSSIIKEKVAGYSKVDSLMNFKQYFNCVFIPKHTNRIEIRISNKVSPRHTQEFNTAIEQKFIEILHNQNLKIPLKPANLYKSIRSLFNDKSVGRVAHAILTTEESNKDAELKGLTDKSYCARTQRVEDTKSKHTYICRAVKIRKSYINTDKNEVEYSIFPNKYDWSNQHCYSLQIDKPETSTMLNMIIDDVLLRSLR